MRGVAFEFRHQRPEASWQRRWDWAIVAGSFIPAFLWGVAFANIVRGVPIDADKNFQAPSSPSSTRWESWAAS